MNELALKIIRLLLTLIFIPYQITRIVALYNTKTDIMGYIEIGLTIK